MKPFEQAVIPDSEKYRLINELCKLWDEGNMLARASFPAPDSETAHELIRVIVWERRASELIFKNDVYQVAVRKVLFGNDTWLHLSVKRIDKQPVHDWRDLQQIKSEIVGPEYEAVELYPAESRLVDSANQFHLWCCLVEGWRFPFGFEGGRFVSDESIGKSVNRPLPEPLPKMTAEQHKAHPKGRW